MQLFQNVKMIEHLCTYSINGKEIRPKYIVSTATIKNASEQINALYGSPLIFNAEEDPVPDILKPYFSHIIRINRLREIMCLKGFTRLDAPDPEAEQQINIVELQKKDWLPAIEVHGEGIFIEFDKNKINEWLNNTSVKKLDIIVKKAFTEYYLSRNWTVTNPRGALYMLMHTFSHGLVHHYFMFHQRN